MVGVFKTTPHGYYPFPAVPYGWYTCMERMVSVPYCAIVYELHRLFPCFWMMPFLIKCAKSRCNVFSVQLVMRVAMSFIVAFPFSEMMSTINCRRASLSPFCGRFFGVVLDVGVCDGRDVVEDVVEECRFVVLDVGCVFEFLLMSFMSFCDVRLVACDADAEGVLGEKFGTSRYASLKNVSIDACGARSAWW